MITEKKKKKKKEIFLACVDCMYREEKRSKYYHWSPKQHSVFKKFFYL